MEKTKRKYVDNNMDKNMENTHLPFKKSVLLTMV